MSLQLWTDCKKRLSQPQNISLMHNSFLYFFFACFFLVLLFFFNTTLTQEDFASGFRTSHHHSVVLEYITVSSITPLGYISNSDSIDMELLEGF